MFYGAQSYDGIMLIDSAVRAVKGNLADKKGMIAAMRKANFPSTRGKYTYNTQPLPDPELLPAEGGGGRGAGADPVHARSRRRCSRTTRTPTRKDCPMKW